MLAKEIENMKRIFLLNLIGALMFSALSVAAASEKPSFKNCSIENQCYKGNRFIAWLTSVRLRGEKLIITATYLSDGGSGVSVRFKNGGFAEVIDANGMISKADRTRLTPVNSIYGSPADIRLLFDVGKNFKPPFDLSIRSSDEGSIDLIDINVR